MHVQCDNESSDQNMLEKRGMYVCKICKYGPAHGRSHNPSGGSANSCSPIHNSSRDELGWDENSLEASDKELARSGSLASDSRGSHQNMGRGKPMSAMAQAGASGFPGKRRRLGMVGRPPGSFSGSSAYSSLSPNSSKPGSMGEKPLGQAVTTMAAAIASKKRGENRKKGLSQSVGARGRGMVALQRPEVEPGLREELLRDEEDNKMICVAVNDDFVLKQDLCVMCGSLGNDLEARLIACTQCGQCYHPHCVNIRVTPVILQKGWRCLDCTACEGCGEKHDEANLILCDECDISFHIYCLDPPLDQVPQDTWKCKW